MATNKQKNTRSKRAAKKASPIKTVEPAQVQNQKLSSAIVLTKQSLKVLFGSKKLFFGVLAIYALLNIVFVGVLGLGGNVAEARDQFGNRFVGSLAAYGQLIAGSSVAADQAAGVYQFFFTLFLSLALIFTLRQVYAGQAVRVRDAYYKGMYPIVPFMLLLLVVLLQLLPLVIGTAVYQFVLVSGVAASGFETVLWLSVALAGLLASIYLLVPTLLAMIVVTLPDMTPMAALRLAKKLVAGRRLIVLRKIIILPVLLLIATAIILLPIIFAFAPAAQFVLLLLSPLLIAGAHSYIYAVYRELVGD